jgi:hypothetical protein
MARSSTLPYSRTAPPQIIGRTASSTTGLGKWPGNVIGCPIGKFPDLLCWLEANVLALFTWGA